MEPLSISIFASSLSILVGIISYFIRRELSNKDKDIARLEERVRLLEQRVQSNEISLTKLEGKIQTIIQILERVEEKLDSK